MEIEFLRHFTFSQRQINILKSAYGEHLLPLQKRVIEEGGIFKNQNLLVCAPTSAGKTFLAEILFLHQTLQNRNLVLLVPTKALANQRYETLKKRYHPFGYDIVLSTRDHPFHDKRILEGRFHFAVVIFEKMQALLGMDDSFLSFIGACVIDEIHYLFDPQRGPELEVLLTRLRDIPRLQLLGLSAVVSDPHIAEWLHASLIIEKKRPVELRQGVLCQKLFRYKEFNSEQEGVESIDLDETDDEGQLILSAAREFANRGEPTLLFWPRRDLCYTAARKLADAYEADSHWNNLQLDTLDPTSLQKFLLYLLPRRVAVHTSDLSPEERGIVEEAVNRREVILLCATGTLAEGINIPVINVITTKRMYSTKPEDIDRGKPPSSLPLSQDRLFNMLGRAGRLGLCDFGRGMIATTAEGDVDGLFATYLQDKQETLQPMLFRLPTTEIILKSMSSFVRFSLETCKETLMKTLSGSMNTWSGSFSQGIETGLKKLLQDGFVSIEDDIFHPTPLGALVMKSGISVASAHRIESFVQDVFRDSTHPLEILVTIALLPEMNEIYLYVPKSEIQTHTWSRHLLQTVQAASISSDSYLYSLLNKPQALRPSHHTAFKKCFLLQDWISGLPIAQLENRYGMYAGAIVRMTEETAWLVSALADMVAAYAFPAEQLRKIQILRERLLFGLPEESLQWSPFIRTGQIPRYHILALIKNGFCTPASVQVEDIDYLQSFLDTNIIDTILHARKVHTQQQDRISSDYILELLPARPDQFLLNGKTITATRLQSDLLKSLARRAGECVAYEILVQEVWPNSIGDRKQLSRQKNALLQKTRKALGHPTPTLIESVPGVGMVLQAEVVRRR